LVCANGFFYGRRSAGAPPLRNPASNAGES
jgi:hypothetical protein